MALTSALLSCPYRQLVWQKCKKLTFKKPIATMSVPANIAAVRAKLCRPR